MQAPNSAQRIADNRPCVVFLTNVLAPGRQMMHVRLRAEVPECEIVTGLLFETNNIAWPAPPLESVGGFMLGPNERTGHNAAVIWRGFGKGMRFVRELRRRKARAVIINGYIYTECWFALAYAKLAGIPALVASDSNVAADGDLKGFRGFLKRTVVGSFVRLCDGVLVFGTQGAKYYARYGASADSTFIMPFATYPALRTPLPPAELAALRAKFGFAANRKRILCSGRFVSYKRFHCAVDAFIAVADKRPDWDLVLAGDGPDRAALEARVPAHLRSRVFWLGMITDPDLVMNLYHDVHLLLHLASLEPWGMIVQEAAAANLPMIVSDVTGAAPDLVENGKNGFMVPVDNAEAAREALLNVTDPMQYPQFVEHAKQTWVQWNEKSDCVKGFRAAMTKIGVLK